MTRGTAVATADGTHDTTGDLLGGSQTSARREGERKQREAAKVRYIDAQSEAGPDQRFIHAVKLQQRVRLDHEFICAGCGIKARGRIDKRACSDKCQKRIQRANNKLAKVAALTPSEAKS